ncbi:MAG: hypothetical protein O7D91_02460 [Planctomycetota bacterium]|nr:hypothetical protein [Planctomycetota bacterium]
MIKRGTRIVVLLIVAGNSGCIMSLSTFENTSGSIVSPDILTQIKEGQTTKDWLIDHLGQPTATADRGDGMEDLTYEAVTRVVEHFRVLLLVSIEKRVDQIEQWVFELKDDIVHRYHRNDVVRAIDD